MKRSLPLFACLLLAITTTRVFGQRYLSEVFTSVNVTYNKAYAANYEFITGSPVFDSLRMDIYEPVGDTATKRPLVLYLHTGSFLPILINGTATGDMRDSATVEMCKQFARRGYTAVSMDYRVGWNPIGSDVNIRTGTLLQAVFRSLQDAKACVRYFKMTAQDMGNPWKIDTNRIIMGGQGSGGYLALAYATLNDPGEITLLKFIATASFPEYGIFQGAPYVITDIWGDFEGFGGVDTLNHDNWPGYTSNIQFMFNMGGAMGDSSWIEDGDIPMVCFHVENDPFAPYGVVNSHCGIPCSCPVIVPTTGQFVVNVAGSHCVMEKADDVYDNNAVLHEYADNATDPYTIRANSINNGLEGLFPFQMPNPQIIIPGDPFDGQAGPWEWWDTTALKLIAPFYGVSPAQAVVIAKSGLLTNPLMSKTQALNYIDTIQEYLAPRIVQTLGLPGMVGINEVMLFNQNATMFPNPAIDATTIELNEPSQTINYVKIYDVTGRMVREISNIGTYRANIYRAGLTAGVYFVKVGVKDKELNAKLMFE